MAEKEQEFKEAVAQHMADMWLDSTTVQEAEAVLLGIASQLGSYEQDARQYFTGLAERADTDGDGLVSAEEIKKAFMAL
ncbi:hypothetical protein ACFWJT_23235 [Streptomyces sp. NPDC127069]|uniref:hypothetical protein n=1 Tax=Streptomyces sp. NPDC127069 TaxID=3347128 RepID=UPI003657D4BC